MVDVDACGDAVESTVGIAEGACETGFPSMATVSDRRQGICQRRSLRSCIIKGHVRKISQLAPKYGYEAIPSRKHGVLVKAGLHAMEVSIPRRTWPACEGCAPQIVADIRCTRVDGSHMVGVRWSCW